MGHVSILFNNSQDVLNDRITLEILREAAPSEPYLPPRTLRCSIRFAYHAADASLLDLREAQARRRADKAAEQLIPYRGCTRQKLT